MIEVTTKLIGFKEMDALLKDLPDAMAKRVLEGAARAGATVVLKAAKANVPEKSGRLKQSLTIVTNKNVFTKFGTVAVRVGANLKGKRGITAPHAHLVEFGTAAHVITPKKAKALMNEQDFFGGEVNHPGAVAKPFLRPAFDNNQQAILSAISKKLWLGITRESAKLAGRYKTKRR